MTIGDRRCFSGQRISVAVAASFAFFALVAVFWRPMIAGFLTDDWLVLVDPITFSAAFSHDRWAGFEATQNRPVLRLILFLLTSLLPPQEIYWHSLGAALNVLAATCVFVLAADILRVGGFAALPAQIGGAFAGLLWLTFPFSAATQFWATGTTSTPAVAAFAASGSLLLRGWQVSRNKLAVGALLSLVGYLNYEGHYFQIALLLAYAAFVLGWRGTNGFFGVAFYVGAFGAAVSYNRLLRTFGADGSHGLNTKFVETFFHWYLYFGRMIGLTHQTVYGLLVVCAVAIGVAFYFALRRLDRRQPLWLCLAIGAMVVGGTGVLATLPLSMVEGAPLIAFGIAMLALLAWRIGDPNGSILPVGLLALAGICLGALPFALANYVVFSLGFGARSTYALSLWLALGFGLLAALAAQRNTRASLLGAALVWTGMLASDLARGREWGRAASELLTIFVDPPEFPFGKSGPQARFLVVAPELPGRVPVIEVNHHVAATVRRAFVAQANDEAKLAEIRAWDTRWFVARNLVWKTEWDGVRFTQRECRNAIRFTDTEISELWLWDVRARSIRQLAPPYSSGCTDAP